MSISLEQARQVAQLARLALSDEELARLAGQLDAILAYVEQLDELETEGVEATTHPVEAVTCPLREDEPQPSSPREAIVGRAPSPEEGFFRVPRVV